MEARIILSAVMLIVFVSRSMAAQSPRPPSAPVGLRIVESPTRPAVERQRSVVSASTLFGMPVSNAGDEQLGRVADLALDLEGGWLLRLIVASTGPGGETNQMFCVEPQAITNTAGNRLLLDSSKWNATPITAESARLGGGEVVPKGRVRKASETIGQPTADLAGKETGKIEDLIVDLDTGRVLGALVRVRSTSDGEGELKLLEQGVLCEENCRKDHDCVRVLTKRSGQ